MSAFSSVLPLDSVLLPINSNTSATTCFSQFYQTENIDQSTKLSALSNNKETYSADLSAAATNKNDMDSSSTVTHYKLITPMGNKRKCRKASANNSAQSKNNNSGVENKKQKKLKDEEEKKAINEGPKGYIHVRARRGQATDSHSLAERVRREKISERMKLLQSIVPGCDKVTGKAPVLDQIINYVQSLQNQVEFLSMKLASLNSISYDFAMEIESFMVSPDQNSSSLSSQLMPAMQQPSPTTINDFLLLNDSPNSIMYHEHSQFPNAPSEGDMACGDPILSDNLFHSI